MMSISRRRSREGLAELGVHSALGLGKVGAAQAEPGRAEPAIAPCQHPPRSGVCDSRGIPVARGQRSLRRRGTRTLPRFRLGPRRVGPGPRPRRGETRRSSTSTTKTCIFAANRMRFTSLGRFGLPEALKRADIVVSMPKLKTHHWVGATLSMKNLFGVMPGVYYGWPKNVLHYAGISESILDITATVRPHLAIVDGIVGMEGDGPIMGTAKAARRDRDGNQLAGGRRHGREADGNRPLADRLSGGGIRPARTDRRAAHRSARRVDRFVGSIFRTDRAAGRPSSAPGPPVWF